MANFINDSLKLTFITGINDTDSESVVLKYRTPSGTESEVSDVTLITAATGEYSIQFAPNQLNEEGTWGFWSYTVLTDGNVTSGDPFYITIIEPRGNYPVNVGQIKSLLGYTDDTHDARINSMIPLLVEQYKEIRNAPFDFQLNDSGEKYYVYPPGMDYVISLMYKYNIDMEEKTLYRTPKSEKIGDYSYTMGDDGSTGEGGSFKYPKFITSKIKRFNRTISSRDYSVMYPYWRQQWR